ncbi:MAG: glycosyl transferase group 1 [Actinomycetia bacterium]|nr:glycosyl transferase group 1 [Actinomycetes bacterium]
MNGPVTMAGSGGPAGLTVSYLLGATAGGTGRHVAMLAGGCAARGATVHVYGPAATGAGLARDEGPVPPAGAADPASPGAGGCGAGATARPASPGPADPDTTGSAPAHPGWDFSAVDVAARPRPGRDGAAVLRLRRVLARDAPDVLHAHGLRAGALAALALALPGTPRTALVVTVHNAPPAGRPAAAVYAGLELIVARGADAVLTVSGDLDDRMRRRGARLAGRAIVPAPAAAEASPAEIAALRREFAGPEFAGRERAGGAPGDPEIVLGVGRLAAQKDFGSLIRAAARWQRRAAVPLLLIAGEGPLDSELRRQARTAGVAVRFLGPRRDVPALLAAADVVVVPSAWEGQPLIVQEALRAGRPLVATRVGGIAELTGDDGARLVPPGDPEALAAAVTRLLDEPEDRGRLAAAARARAALLPTGTAAVDQVLSLYQHVR